MKLETFDPALVATIRRRHGTPGLLRLTIDYPANDPVAGRVQSFLAELIRPSGDAASAKVEGAPCAR